MTKTKRYIAFALAIASLAVSSCRLASGELTYDEAAESLKALLKKVDYSDESSYITASDPHDAIVGRQMPDISTYPLTAKGDGSIDVEIASSTEKAVADTDSVKTDSWLLHMALAFNAQMPTINGQTVSVSIRPLASGTATDYILSGEYVPEAFTPSNELWAEMIKSKGIPIEMAAKRLCGNTAGLLIKPEAYEMMLEKYTEITMQTALKAVIAGDLLMGYTNPYTSSTGLNNLICMLYAIDPQNLTSEKAASELSAFQALIPSTSYTTAELINKAANGTLDCLSMEYQAYSFKSEFRDWKFIPFGVRHDSPIYTIGNISEEKRQALSLFIDFCLRPENQAEAKAKYGFNEFDSYSAESMPIDGGMLIQAQSIWKKAKDAGRPVIAVFIADESGSMEGTPIKELKTSLKHASQYISSTNYIGLVGYSSDVRIYLPVSRFEAAQRNKFLNAVDYLSASGSTATYNAILVGLEMLVNAKKEVPNAKLMMFVLSDGDSTKGSRYYAFEKVEPVIRGLGIPIHALGYNVSNNELKELAAINEASYIGTSMDDIVYQLKNIFNAQM